MEKSSLNTILYLAKFVDESCVFNGDNMSVFTAISKIYYKDHPHRYTYMIYITDEIMIDEKINL